MGLRIGELCALKKESFDLDNYTITVNIQYLELKMLISHVIIK